MILLSMEIFVGFPVRTLVVPHGSLNFSFAKERGSILESDFFIIDFFCGRNDFSFGWTNIITM